MRTTSSIPLRALSEASTVEEVCVRITDVGGSELRPVHIGVVLRDDHGRSHRLGVDPDGVGAVTGPEGAGAQAAALTAQLLATTAIRVRRPCAPVRSSSRAIWPPRSAGATTPPWRSPTGSGRSCRPPWSSRTPPPVRSTSTPRPPRPTPIDQHFTALLAGQAAIAVTAALRHDDEVTLSDHLRTALSSRSVIDQAIGIVMSQSRRTADEFDTAQPALRAAPREPFSP